MAEINYSPPRGNRVQEVSRQFTGAERMMDDRMTAHITQELPSLQVGVGSRTAYGWLEEDLKRRSLVTSVLNQERQIAEAQGVRQEMDRRFAQDTEDEADAIQAHNRMTDMMKTGMSPQEASSILIGENPQRALNPKFTGTLETRLKLYESDDQRKLREMSTRANLAKTELSAMSDEEALEQMKDPAYQSLRKDVRAWESEKARLSLGLDRDDMRLKSLDMQHNIRTAIDRAAMFEQLGPEGSLEAEALSSNFLRETGISPMNPRAVIDIARGDKRFAEMLSNPAWIKDNMKPEELSAFEASLDTFVDENAKPEDKRAARKVIADALGSYIAGTESDRKALERREQIGKIGSDIGDSLDDVSKELRALRTGGDDGLPEKGAGIAAMERADSWIKSLAARHPNGKAALSELNDWKKDNESITDPAKRITHAENFMRSFAEKLGDSMNDGVTKPTPEGSPSPAPSGGKPITEAEYKSLPAGAKYIAPNGKEYIKR